MASAAVDQVTYEDLYARWEKGNWRATEIDFSEDREQWQNTFTEFERRAALWNYAMFFHGEDDVAQTLSPYIDAAPREEQKYFLATQQVDEARHAVFFTRFMHEAAGQGRGDVASGLEATRDELSWGFVKVFERLDRMADELRKDRSRPKLAAAITLYHFVIEASMAQPGQHYIEDYLTAQDRLPGFRAGMKNVSLDEQRHIAFGVKMLSDLNREDPDCAHAVAELLREVIPWTTAVFVPPNWDRNYSEVFGFTLEDIFADGASSIDAKLRAAGLPPEDLPGGVPLRPDLTPRERADQGIAMLQANLLGEKNGPPSHDPETMAMLFEATKHAIDRDAAPAGGATIQWVFADAEPWHLHINNGLSAVTQGRASDPDLTFHCRWEDWVDIAARRTDPRKALLTGRIRPRGTPRALWRTRHLFPR